MTKEIKTINGKKYAYEVSMVWDPDHNKRHRASKYLGKIINDDARNPRKVRELAETPDMKPELFPKKVPS